MTLSLPSRWLLLFVVVVSLATAAKDDVDYGIPEWIRNSKGGYFNPKLEFRKRNNDNTNSNNSRSMGVFAKERIAQDELLLQVPWYLILKGDDADENGQMCCGTVEMVAREMSLKDASFFAPYVNYLNDLLPQDDNTNPSGWSKSGKQYLQHLVGGTVDHPFIPPVQPTEWLDIDWLILCHGDPNDYFKQKAALLVVQRADDRLMIPGYDWINHRNAGLYSGDWLNSETTTTEGEHVQTIATRIIEPGEEIHNSYNMCQECAGRREGYGTGEILRDYGFVEAYPQRWHYLNTDLQFFVDVDNNGILHHYWDARMYPRPDDRANVQVWLRRQIRRLRRAHHVYCPNKPKDMPDHEYQTAQEFLQANIKAMILTLQALDAMGDAKKQTCSMDSTDEMCLTLTADSDVLQQHHYDPLEPEVDDLGYVDQTCDNTGIMRFDDWDTTETLKTHYQTLNFMEKPEMDDICMDLDDIVQICSCYRPHYHEYSVHAAARFIDKVKKVIFIGGGDSMLLHEVLKYPTLELVVGLELDQTVTRKCFKHFKTSPHFDDPRVEWWFGDATKSLLLLPEEYWGTFDLVLVDLSETVMSLSVTKELDVFDALALLLKPDGIMVKNELYFEHLTKVFDHSIQLFYESPIICSQSMAMGSNRVDFLHKTPLDHGVDTLLYEGMHTDAKRFDFLHDYRKSYALEQGKCGELPKRNDDDSTEQGRSAGILEIMDAENTTVPLDKVLADLMGQAIKGHGFSIITLPLYQPGLILVEMKEGYVLARLFPDNNYVAFDIQLWGSFHKLKPLSQSLAKTVGSSLVSKYRVVVGGMYGSSTWKEDKKIIGPQIVQNRNCEEQPVPSGDVSAEKLVETMLWQAVGSLVYPDDNVIAVVVCGSSEYCQAEALLLDKNDKTQKITKVHKIVECPGLSVDDDTKAKKMYDCERSLVREMERKLGGSEIDLMVFDGSVSYEMIQIWNSILDTDELRENWIQQSNVVMAWSTNPSQEPWRQQFLDRYRKQHESDPIAHGSYTLKSQSAAVQFGLVATEDEDISYNLAMLERRVRLSLQQENNDDDVHVELHAIQGGLFPFTEDFEPKLFKQSDYDDSAGQAQYKGQQPFGRQVLFQLEPDDSDVDDDDEEEEDPDAPTELSVAIINGGLEQAFQNIGMTPTSHHWVSDIGDGVVLVYFAPQGQVIVVWDGQTHLDVNLYLKEDYKNLPQKFMGAFLHHVRPTLKVALRDDMPRGIGRVINLKGDTDWKLDS